ncbi:Hypothetical protein IALB_2332 [Ignavibacterium album JCM 16511]|uniref:Uncharacterized protein n=1 Tax=Ignavibacterium album (strain DSM 19864 / JCM 16511 / NBRC 101810 / Mat9-16) TaxID=945713 RepID=I0AM28_IGNAJ|nr:Hypothetical protein IALB_2332 [Ignavibacterium album JCM 16511]
MKKILFFVVLITSVSIAHRQHVHQYITIEAYNLLKLSIGYDIPTLQSRIGGTSSWYIGDRPWQRGYITTGAWREDEEDVVYGYSKSSPPTLTGITGSIYSFISIFGGLTPDGFVSSTHFWYADDGDELSTTMRAGVTFLGTHVTSFTVPNAYQKIQKYLNGEWIVHYNYGQTVGAPGWQVCVPPSYPIIGMAFKYDNLFEFFRTGKAYGLGYRGISGNWQYCDPTIVYFGQEFRERIAFEILGRMCHLLQDMSVPAHANIDPHGNDDALIPDYYENYFGDDFYWNADNIYTQIGGVINPTLYQPSNPLHFLMYTTNQMSNHFSTQGPHKKSNNDYFSGNGTSAEIAYLNSLNVSQFGIPTSDNGPWNYDAIINVRNKMFPQAIRATAGLLYWFANECNLIPPPPTIAPIISNFTQSPKPIYQGTSGTVTCNLSQGNGNLTYNWSIVYGKPGVSVSFYGNQAEISYSSNSLNYKASENGKYSIEAPIGIELQCSVYNSIGSDVKRYVVDLATTPHGCPFVYTWNGETWVEDNNILPQSQDPDLLGQDVTDFYQLYTKPVLEDDKYYLAIGEYEEV